MTTRTDFLNHFSGGNGEPTTASMEFEQQALSIGREFLPAEAIAVLDGAEPTAAYWAWLCEQASTAESEWAQEQEYQASLK